MTPLDIEQCIHYHCSPVDSPWVLAKEAPIIEEVMGGLVDRGLLEIHANDPKQKFHPTERLHAFVHAICEMPLPVQVWVNGETGKQIVSPLCNTSPTPTKST